MTAHNNSVSITHGCTQYRNGAQLHTTAYITTVIQLHIIEHSKTVTVSEYRSCTQLQVSVLHCYTKLLHVSYTIVTQLHTTAHIVTQLHRVRDCYKDTHNCIY